MSTLQKVIKYGAMAFGFYLVFIILSVIISIIIAIFGISVGFDAYKTHYSENESSIVAIDEIYENGFIDKNSKSYKDDIKELTQIFSRGGSFSTGYFKSFSGVEMISDSQKNTGIKIGIVENYNKIKHICKIRLYSDIKSGDGIEIWTKTEPHVGIGISKNSNSCDLVNIKIEGNISKGDFVYKSFDKELDDKIKNLIKKSYHTLS